jgi:mRNA-degrading endonuclease YafQ of YafQ-DinJ toxin-antitoxin module
MSYRIIYTESYLKRASRFGKKHPDLVSQYQKTLKILELNPQHPSLRLHQLQGKLKNLHSVSINMSFRIILEFYVADQKIVLVNIGHHNEVY